MMGLGIMAMHRDMTSMNMCSEICGAHLAADTIRPRRDGSRRRRRSYAVSLALTVASSGGTTLEGRVLRADDEVPLQGVTLCVEFGVRHDY